MKEKKEKLQKVDFEATIKTSFYSTSESEKKDIIRQIKENIKEICEDNLSFIKWSVKPTHQNVGGM
jgi:hypothetical protein